MQYEWHNAKAALNHRKHGIDFTDAIAALEDPNRLEKPDPEVGHGEERILVIGMAYSNVLFFVATFRGENTCRLISARRAARLEEDRYYAGDREAW